MTVRDFDADEHRNDTEEVGEGEGRELRIYCANCGDPEEETGYATPEQLRVHVDGWHEVDDHLCCSVYCAAKFEHGDEEKAQEARAQKTSENAGGE